MVTQQDFRAMPAFWHASHVVVAIPDRFEQARVVIVTPVVETRIDNARKTLINWLTIVP